MRAALRAEYGLDLRRPGINLLDLADLVVHLPAGCALWRATGGPLAFSDETYATLAVRHGLDVLAWQNTGIMTEKPKGKPPAPPEPPPLASSEKAKERAMNDKRARYLERQRARRSAKG